MPKLLPPFISLGAKKNVAKFPCFKNRLIARIEKYCFGGLA